MIEQVFIVHHTHTDIGYTDIQTTVMANHVDFLDKVLDYCRRTDACPEASKFRWTCEVAWAVKQYFEKRPRKINEFIRRVKEGRIEVTGLYLNVTELYSLEEFIRSLLFAKGLEKKYGIKVAAAMNCDINGLAWGLPQILASVGIRYLAMATNLYRAFQPRVARPFYWLSPSGHKVLVWNAGSAGWYTEGLGLGFGGNYQMVAERLPAFLEKAEKTGYPFDALCLQVAMDNRAPNLEVSRIIGEWNEKHGRPKIRMAILSDFFQYLEGKYRKDFPAYQLAWPDWWADGNASAAYETGLSRETHRILRDVEKVYSWLALLEKNYPAPRIKQAWENLSFFDEHTWGAATSSTKPYSLPAKSQWALKSSFVYQAALAAQELIKKGLPELVGRRHKAAKGDLAIFNSLPWERKGVVKLPLPKDPAPKSFRFLDGGRVLSCQIEGNPHSAVSKEKEVYFFVKNIPAMGYKICAGGAGATVQKSGFVFGAHRIANRFYEVRLDPVTGGIQSIYDKLVKRELVDQNSPYRFNQYIYEEIISAKGKNALFDYESANCLAEKRRDVRFRRSSPQSCKISKGKNGPVLGSLIVTTKAKGCARIIQEIILYRELKRLDIVNTLQKIPTVAAEAVYYAFPFNVRVPEFRLDTAGAVMRPEVDQLPGTAKDWYSIQDWLSLSDKEVGIVWISKEAPLVQLGDINTGKWVDGQLKIKHGTIFSWVMNNYHPTNFPASQGGEITFHYSITSQKRKASDGRATLFAQECQNDFMVYWFKGDRKEEQLNRKDSFFAMSRKDIVLLAVKQSEDGKGLIVRLQEVGGKKARLKLKFHSFTILGAFSATLTEEIIKPLSVSKNEVEVTLGKFEITTVKIIIKKS
jgi:hypothetical protein